MRRGIKEMDIILTRFADAQLEAMAAPQLDLYEQLLNEHDQDLYQWVTGQTTAPEHLACLIDEIAALVDASGQSARG